MRDEARPRALPFTELDRAWALEALYDASVEFGAELDEAELEFWPPDFQGDLEDAEVDLADGVFYGWAWFDRPLHEGKTPAQWLLKGYELSAGVRRYLELMSESVTKLYEVVETRPGSSITFRSVIEGTEITVRERTLSRTATRGMLIAARLILAGKSGEPELESGPLHFPELSRRPVVEALRARWTAYRKSNPGATPRDFWKQTPPFFWERWLRVSTEPAIPEITLRNGELVLPTTVTFELEGEPSGVSAKLDAASSFAWDTNGNKWLWEDSELPLPVEVLIRDGRLKCTAISVEQGARVRVVLERELAGLIVHRSTTHGSIRSRLNELMSESGGGAQAPTGIDEDVQEVLILNAIDRHYTEWVDVPVPALDGKTPRDAAKEPSMRGRLGELIRGLEGAYERDLRHGRPAYDPSWMWVELGLVDADEPKLPPPLAHERWAQRWQWDDELATLVGAVREHPGFDDARTVIDSDPLRFDLQAQRLLRELKDEAQRESLTRAMMCAMNHELHRRRTFWVSEPLTFMLAHTDPELGGRELRLPFASFALVFTDRHALSRGERLLARSDNPLRGYILRALTVYVREGADQDADPGSIVVDFAFDAMGDDPPWLVSHRIDRTDEAILPPRPAPVVLEQAGETLVMEKVEPLADLLKLVVNTILYATSAGVKPEEHRPAAAERRRRGKSETDPTTNDSVLYLSGKITISDARRLQALARSGRGGELLHRFMVRGRWRRPNPSWKDQRLRWIEPYWKGPDLASVIERQYQLT